MTTSTRTPAAPTSPAADQDLTPKQLAYRWQLKPATVTQWARDKKIIGAKLLNGRVWRFDQDCYVLGAEPRPAVVPAAEAQAAPVVTVPPRGQPVPPTMRRGRRPAAAPAATHAQAAGGKLLTPGRFTVVLPAAGCR